MYNFFEKMSEILDRYEKMFRLICAVMIAIIFVLYGYGMVVSMARHSMNDLFLTKLVGDRTFGELILFSTPIGQPKSLDAVYQNQLCGQSEQNSTTTQNQNTVAPDYWEQAAILTAIPVYFAHIAIPTGFVILIIMALLDTKKVECNERYKSRKALGFYWLAAVIGISLPFFVIPLLAHLSR